MTPAVSAAIPTRWRRLVLATLLAGAAAFATTSFGSPPTAGAAPSWDIEKYDNCLAFIPKDAPIALQVEFAKGCCEESGGVWKENLGAGGKCVTPPGEGPGAGPENRVPTDTPPDVAPPPPPPPSLAPPAPVQPPAVR